MAEYKSKYTGAEIDAGIDKANKAVDEAYVDAFFSGVEESIADRVISALGTPVFGTVDADNNIILSGKFMEGTYVVKYEDANGNVTTIGTINGTDAPTYTNMLTASVDSSGNPYNGGQGWKANTRLNSSGAEAAYDGIEVTGFIPVKFGDTIHFYNITCGASTDSPANSQQYLLFYDGNKSYIGGMLVSGYYNQYWNDTNKVNGGMDANGNIAWFYLGSTFSDFITGKGSSPDNVAYFRISCEEITTNSIITINETVD